MALDISHGILSWIIDLLKDRKERVKLEQDCKSEWGDIPAGVPQDTKFGPWLFILMIDDINTSDTEIWKYGGRYSYHRACGQEPSKNEAEFAPIVINEKAIKVVSSVKLLGLNFSKDLKWNCHVSEISRKVLFPQATEEGKRHNMQPSGHRVR